MFYYGLSSNTIFNVFKNVMWQAKEEYDCDAFCTYDYLDNDRSMLLDQLNFITGDGL